MSGLIKIKNRIKAIETTEKVTKAMRLISMSLHAKLKLKASAVQRYDDELINLFGAARQSNENWKSSFLSPEHVDRTLIILIGSQKGLCGNFNSQLFNFFKIKIKNYHNFDLISIGKKACDFSVKLFKPIKQYPNLTLSTLNHVTNELYNLIVSQDGHYSNVIIFYNHSKSFLVQQPTLKQIIPAPEINSNNKLEEYAWEEPIDSVLDTLAKEYLRFTLQATLTHSLLAEQAARFRSMDSATHNAENLLTEMKRQYSKQRQAKITKEIIELTGAF